MTNNIKEMTNEELYTKYNDHITKNCNIAQSKCHRMLSRGEAVQVGWFAFIKMMQNYQPRANSTEKDFLALSGIRVRGAILDEIRKIGGMKTNGGREFYTVRKFEVSLDQILENSHEPPELGYLDHRTPEKNIEDLVSVLKDANQKTIIRSMYKYEKTMAEIAFNLNMSESRISQIHHQALAKLRWYHGEIRYAA